MPNIPKGPANVGRIFVGRHKSCIVTFSLPSRHNSYHTQGISLPDLKQDIQTAAARHTRETRLEEALPFLPSANKILSCPTRSNRRIIKGSTHRPALLLLLLINPPLLRVIPLLWIWPAGSAGVVSCWRLLRVVLLLGRLLAVAHLRSGLVVCACAATLSSSGVGVVLWLWGPALVVGWLRGVGAAAVGWGFVVFVGHFVFWKVNGGALVRQVLVLN